MLKDKGKGMVLNRDEIIEYVDKSDNLWLTKDFQIEAELEFVVMAALAALGEIEITLSSGETINSTNLNKLKDIDRHDFFSFGHIKPPKGLNLAALRLMFVSLLGRDLSNQLRDPSTYTHLVNAAGDWAKRTVVVSNTIQGGYKFKGVEIVSPTEAAKYSRDFLSFSRFCDKLANYTTEARIKNFQFSTDELNALLPIKSEVETLENTLQALGNLNNDISYLQQARQYITEEDFKNEIAETLNQLASVISSNDAAKMANYESKLSQLKERYADWYLNMYLKYRISERDNTQKHALLDSEEKSIADILKVADFLPTGQYAELERQLASLKPADSAVNKNLILTAPYQDFNPLEFEGKESLSIKQLKDSLSALLEEWIHTLKETLEDPVVKKNMGLLNDKQQKLLLGFKANNIALSKDNAVVIRNAIMDLHQGLEKVELSLEGMKSTFNKPLTTDEAIDAFREYIDNVSKGKEREKIRIILK